MSESDKLIFEKSDSEISSDADADEEESINKEENDADILLNDMDDMDVNNDLNQRITESDSDVDDNHN
eukprot:UN03171